MTGTARYASINALQGYEQSRRDDLESVGYVLMYFLRGRLPWQGLIVKGKENKYERILQKKRETETSELCKGYPKQFEEYLEYTKKLGYEEDPDYGYLRGLFEGVVKESGFTLDYLFDWVDEFVIVEKETYDFYKDNQLKEGKKFEDEDDEEEDNNKKIKKMCCVIF